MLGIIVLLLLSWLLMWLFEKGDLSVLGLRPTAKRLKFALLLFLITSACCAAGYLLRMWWGHERYEWSPQAGPAYILQGVWVNIRSVLTEELLCRGVALYLLIKKLGQRWGILISSIVFGVLHWFNLGVLGNAIQMAQLFAYTFTMGLVLAYAYAKSGSLWWPFAIHLGWNLTQNLIFPDGPFGYGLLVRATVQQQVTVSYAVFFMIMVLPQLSAIIINYLVVRRSRIQFNSPD